MPSDSHHSTYQSYLLNKRKTVFQLLDKNALLTPNDLILMLGIPKNEQKKEYGYIKKLRHDWKGYHPKQRGSYRSCPDEVHNVFYRGVLPVSLVKGVFGVLGEVWCRAGADRWVFPSSPGVKDGWKQTGAKNHYLLFKNGQGRIRLFLNGTVELFVRKPASDGKCMQLFCDAFTKTKLVDSIRVVEVFQGTLMRRMHATFETGMKQKYMKITAFQDTHKLTFIAGDRTHPTCYEFILEYHAEVAQARLFAEKLGEFFDLVNWKGSSGNGGVKPLERDYSS